MAVPKRKASISRENSRPEKKRRDLIAISKLSKLREDEPAFPRGGASVLTPLEHKQIQVQAKNDVLFEQKTGKKSVSIEFGNEENNKGPSSHDHKPLPKAKRKNLSKSTKATSATVDRRTGPRIEGLSYKVSTNSSLIKVDVANSHLDLSARAGTSNQPLSLRDVSKGMVMPGRVTKISDRHIMVQLSKSLAGPVHLIDLADDYSKADPKNYQKNQTIQVCVRDIDVQKNKILLSTRPSKVLSGMSPVEDPEINSISQLKVGDVVRGFVKNVADSGLFISLSSTLTALVRVSNLSDLFLKDWKSSFEIGQLIKGKVIALDQSQDHVQMSLKRSHIDKDYKAPLKFSDMKIGEFVTGKIRKVEDFGVFIVVDGSMNVSGLCHRSEMADARVPSPKKLYAEGDAVQAKILKIDQSKSQISFGLKASYFKTQSERDTNLSSESETSKKAAGEHQITHDEDSIDGIKPSQNSGDVGIAKRRGIGVENEQEINKEVSVNGDSDDRISLDNNQKVPKAGSELHGLNAGGFDWSGCAISRMQVDSRSETDVEESQPRKKKRRKTQIEIDKTGDLDANGPQSIADFERLLMGQPNSSVLWISYMAFQLQLSEVSKAREIGERAIKIINMRDEIEKLNVWVALLNLENTYGTDESIDQVFQRACQYNDSQEIHERLISIYIQSGKNEKADSLFQSALKKFSQVPSLWQNYSTFLLTTLHSPDRARALLPRAMQTLPQHNHLSLTTKFAQLEFTSPHGSPERGRTLFEGLISTFPKRLDLWNILLDLEIKQGEANREQVRGLFERVTNRKMKAKKAKFFFKKWLAFEETGGGEKAMERVKARAEEYVKALAAGGKEAGT